MSTPHVYSYARCSTPKQAFGDSELRQMEAAEHWAKRKGYTLDPLGFDMLSSFRGKHRKKGVLGSFLRRVKAGEIASGSILVVEKMTRLTREGSRKALKEIVLDLIEAGIILQTLSPELAFDQDGLDNRGLMHVLIALLDTAYRESKDKSDYGKRNWAQRRLHARENGKLLCTNLPAWLVVKHGKPVLIPERAEAIRRIFALAAQGMGLVRIVRTLTAEGIPCFTSKGKWNRRYLDKLLNDRRVLGELQPFEDGKPTTQLLHNHYPPVVTEREFLAARIGAEKRTGHKGPRQGKHVNLFKGLLRHAPNGETFYLRNMDTAEKPHLVLVASSAVEGRGKYVSFPLIPFETEVLEHLHEIKPSDVLDWDGPTEKRNGLQKQLESIGQEVAQLKADLDRHGYSPALADHLRKREGLYATIRAELDSLEALAAHPAERDFAELKQFVNEMGHGVVTDTNNPEGARIRLASIIARLVESAWLSIKPQGDGLVCEVSINLRSGSRRGLVIEYQRGKRQRPASWTSTPL
jgi:DNA invertase Pin-like site-specific DNA recombinase